MICAQHFIYLVCNFDLRWERSEDRAAAKLRSSPISSDRGTSTLKDQAEIFSILKFDLH